VLGSRSVASDPLTRRSGQCARVRFPPSLPKVVADVDDAAAEPVLVDELKIGARVGRQCRVAPTEDDRPDEQGQLVDQPGDESLYCEVRTTHQEIPAGGGLQIVYRAGVEAAFEPRVRGERGGQGRGVDDLVAACHALA
jgi:hypothetical protein